MATWSVAYHDRAVEIVATYTNLVVDVLRTAIAKPKQHKGQAQGDPARKLVGVTLPFWPEREQGQYPERMFDVPLPPPPREDECWQQQLVHFIAATRWEVSPEGKGVTWLELLLLFDHTHRCKVLPYGMHQDAPVTVHAIVAAYKQRFMVLLRTHFAPGFAENSMPVKRPTARLDTCLLYTSDAADE